VSYETLGKCGVGQLFVVGTAPLHKIFHEWYEHGIILVKRSIHELGMLLQIVLERI
jgi:hypothetical protein